MGLYSYGYGYDTQIWAVKLLHSEDVLSVGWVVGKRVTGANVGRSV